jgi:hypothetical protein
MARPKKSGLDYFPVDVDIHEDPAVAFVEAKYGVMAFGLLIRLMARIYRNGYYLLWSEREQYLFAKDVNVDIMTTKTIVNEYINEGFFSQKLYEQYGVITSRGIQKRYIKAVDRRTKVVMYKEVFLINPEKDDVDLKNVTITPVSADENPSFMSAENPQRKEKESKEKEITPPISSQEEFDEKIFDGLTVPDDAKAAHDKITEWLGNLGYDCHKEIWVDDRGDGRRGRIDIVASNNAHTLAIEIDRLTPREKSVFKLKQVNGVIRIILLRGTSEKQSIPEIQAVLGIPLESEEERTPYQQVLDEYNRLCVNMPRAEVLSEDRRRSIKARINECKELGGIEAVFQVFRYASQSPHHNGKNDTGWRADFDWLMGPKNFRKMLERARSGTKPAGAGNGQRPSRMAGAIAGTRAFLEGA